MKFLNKPFIGFTLAEIIIVIGIVGIVAEIVMPELIKNMIDYTYAKKIDIFDLRINEAMNQMKTNEEMDKHPTSTAFVNAFNRYMKINETCDATDFKRCFPATIYASNGKAVNVATKLKTGVDFGKSTYTSPLVGAMFNNGISALISYDPACVAQNPYDNQAVATGCLSMVYDVNGFGKPNQVGKDIKLYNVDQLGPNCAFEDTAGTCYGAPFNPPGISQATCNANKAALGISSCPATTDYWAGAVMHCGGVSKMASTTDIGILANAIYNTNNCNAASYCYGTFRSAISSSYGLPSSAWYTLYTSTLYDQYTQVIRHMEPNQSYTDSRNRSSNAAGTAICKL